MWLFVCEQGPLSLAVTPLTAVPVFPRLQEGEVPSTEAETQVASEVGMCAPPPPLMSLGAFAELRFPHGKWGLCLPLSPCGQQERE